MTSAEPYSCGKPGAVNGLRFIYQAQGIPNIPYRKLVEIPVIVQNTGACNNFVNIPLVIKCSCEIPSESSSPYQYGSTYINGSYAIEYVINATGKANVMPTLISSALLSFSWKPASSVATSTSPDMSASTTDLSQQISTKDIIFIVLLSLIFLLGIMILLQVRANNHTKGSKTLHTKEDDQPNELHQIYGEQNLSFLQANKDFQSPSSRSFIRKSFNSKASTLKEANFEN